MTCVSFGQGITAEAFVYFDAHVEVRFHLAGTSVWFVNENQALEFWPRNKKKTKKNQKRKKKNKQNKTTKKKPENDSTLLHGALK